MTLREYKPTLKEELKLDEGGPGDVVEVLQHLQPGQFYSKYYPRYVNTRLMEEYTRTLKEAGLDIGRDDSSQFGYRMPLPEKDAPDRSLIIFRRK